MVRIYLSYTIIWFINLKSSIPCCHMRDIHIYTRHSSNTMLISMYIILIVTVICIKYGICGSVFPYSRNESIIPKKHSPIHSKFSSKTIWNRKCLKTITLKHNYNVISSRFNSPFICVCHSPNLGKPLAYGMAICALNDLSFNILV